MSELQVKPSGFFDRFWPATLITVGLGLTIVWVCVLGYGVIKLVELVI
jgi:hypothetical protein